MQARLKELAPIREAEFNWAGSTPAGPNGLRGPEGV